MTRVTVEQAKQRLSELVNAAVSGEEIVLIRDDAAAVRLVPVTPAEGRPQFGSAKGLISMSDDFDAPLEDFHDYRE